jgi:hypothetical protein
LQVKKYAKNKPDFYLINKQNNLSNNKITHTVPDYLIKLGKKLGNQVDLGRNCLTEVVL